MRNSSYNLIPILSKLCHFSGIFTMKVNGQWVPLCATPPTVSCQLLYMCYGHGLKICMWFGYNPWIIFCHFFHNLNLVIFFGHFSEWIEGTLCAQLLLQFNTDTFETLQTL